MGRRVIKFDTVIPSMSPGENRKRSNWWPLARPRRLVGPDSYNVITRQMTQIHARVAAPYDDTARRHRTTTPVAHNELATCTM